MITRKPLLEPLIQALGTRPGGSTCRRLPPSSCHLEDIPASYRSSKEILLGKQWFGGVPCIKLWISTSFAGIQLLCCPLCCLSIQQIWEVLGRGSSCLEPWKGPGCAWHKSLKKQGVLALLSAGPDREQRVHQHQPQLIPSVPACLSPDGSWSQGLQKE